MSKAKGTAAVIAPPNCERRLLTRREAAACLGVSQATLSRWAADRTGPPFIKLHDGDAGAVRYPTDLLDAFIESRIMQPKS
jgi:predicted DNA-binding transcriptional regulator AlpA